MTNPVRTTEGLFLVSLMRSALRAEPPAPAPSDLDWSRLFALAQRHKVDATVFRAVERLGTCPAPLFKRWQATADNALRCELLYDAERSALLAEFDRADIDYLPLKGILLKDLYPHKGMRQFADNDILFRKKQKRKLKKLMIGQGYRCGKNSDYSAHDVYTKPPIFNFEMHRALFNRSENTEYFEKIWQRAVKGERKNEYRMTSEDFYLYNLAHFHKHYHSGGAGFRFFADLYLLLHRFPCDRAAIDRVLKEQNLLDFDREMCDIAEGWFGDFPHAAEDSVFEFIQTSGVYGTVEHSVQNQVREGGLFRYIFLPFKEMKARFPFLKYLPFLLPFCWIFRFFRAFFSRKKIKRALLVRKFGKEKKA